MFHMLNIQKTSTKTCSWSCNGLHILETVAIDLKQYIGPIILHTVDHSTRLLASVVMQYNQPKTIAKYIFKRWIFIFG